MLKFRQIILSIIYMIDIDNLPVLILAYNRNDKLKRSINTLKSHGIKKIFVSIDGARSSSDVDEQKLILNFCRKNDLELDITINHLSSNYGCRLAPVKGISWFFESNKYGVILEDDVTVSKNCLEVFDLLLKKYSKSKRFMTLTSFYEYDHDEYPNLYSLPVWRSWGWASWSNKWFEHIELVEKIENYSMNKLYKLLPEGLKSYETIKILKSCQLNLLDAWDYEFNFTHIIKNYKSLAIGGINTQNYGFDKSATHTFNEDHSDIDFSLYKESKINDKNIVVLNFSESKMILEKCGFHFSEYKHSENEIKNKIIFLFFSIFYKLRKIKRFFFKN